jgi:hypothetical protein
MEVREEDNIPVPIKGNINLLFIVKLDFSVVRTKTGNEFRYSRLHY